MPSDPGTLTSHATAWKNERLCLVTIYIYIYVVSVFIFSYYDLMNLTKSWGFVTPGTPATSMVLAAEVAKARVEHVARLNVFNFQPLKNSISWNIYFFCWVFIFGVLKIIYHHIIMFVWKFANIAAKPVAIKQWFCKTFWNPWTDFGCGASFCKVPTDSVRFGEVRWDLKERNREV